MNKYKNEYRCTRTELYNDPHCMGHKNLSDREGHYIHTDSEQEALAKMKSNYPSENDFTVDLVKTYDDEGKVTRHDIN